MLVEQVPLLYFPPTVIIVDDNEAFLHNFGMELGSRYSGKLETYKDSLEAANILIKRETIFKNYRDYLVEIKSDKIDSDNRLTEVDYEAIAHLTFDKSKFNEPAVVIIDYAMPKLNGIKFCEKINNLQCLKIMLTGEADYKIAVGAFNSGIIDRFVLKDVDNVYQEVACSIEDAITQYFLKLSTYFHHGDVGIYGCYEYIKTFHRWKTEKSIVEYYVISGDGSILGVNDKGDLRWFFISTDERIKNHIDIAVSNHAVEKVVSILSSGKSMLALFTEAQKKESVNSWGKYLVGIDGSFKYDGDIVRYAFVDSFENIFAIDSSIKKPFKQAYSAD